MAARPAMWLVGAALLASASARATDPAPQAEAESGPDAADSPSVTMSPSRGQLLLGTDQDLDVAVEVSGPGADLFVPVRALATVGTLEMPTQTGPGHFKARYLPPAERFPQIALLVVELAQGPARIHAFTRLALDGSTTIPFHTTAGAEVTMRVADRVFGPVAADQKGHVEIPIQVPPGVRRGQARAVDHNGATRETDVDLQLPPFPRVVLLAPPALEAGGFSEVVVVGLAGDGSPCPAGALTLTASAGLAHPRGAGRPGEARFLFEAPRRVGSGAVALTAVADGLPPSRWDVAIPLQASTPARLVIEPPDVRLVVGDPEPVRIVVSARDRFDNPTSAAGVEVEVDGRPAAARLSANGTAVVGLTPPGTYDGRQSLPIRARLGNLRVEGGLHLAGGRPTRLTLAIGAPRIIADGRRATELRVQAVDKNGTPTVVPGLSWDTPDGRVRQVRVPRDGEYVADYVPRRAREPRLETVGVMASENLRAEGRLEVMPPPIRLLAGARFGLFSNLGRTAGPAAFLEALAPLRLTRIRVLGGGSVGYLRGDVTTAGVDSSGTARLETNQIPVLLLGRVLVGLPFELELGADVAVGWSWAWTRITASPAGSPAVESARANAFAVGAGTEVSHALPPGRLAVGLRYLWIDLDRTSQGDRISGNSAGLIGDLGYKIAF